MTDPMAEDELDTILNHTVYKDGDWPNGSGGEWEYWKGDKTLPLKTVLVAYTTNKIIEELEKDCEHSFSKAYGFCTKCGRSWQSIEVARVSRIKALNHRKDSDDRPAR